MHFDRLLSGFLKHTFQGSTNCQIFYPKRLSLLDGAWTLDQPVASAVQRRAVAETLKGGSPDPVIQ